ncbi:hypothetical protein EV356DRAFT_516915 [Viridothelium virens]|uniref:Uncharacterized protein n=1 Tax=Viridothelium virens TaxID=1048519 RepID=A0A6A6H5I0_VIRVR|nr:hypothetical protein EV356DRAFT_516915 [Viridothelium virens]
MAFRRPPQVFQQQRRTSYANSGQQLQPDSIPSPQRKGVLEESQEWVLFSPTAAPSTIQTPTTSTERTPKTVGRSRLSDFGSLDTAARSDEDGHEEEDDDATCQGTEIDEEENEELDSLDDGLHAFHEQSERIGLAQRPNESGSILPTHDGLGGFRASAAPVQEHLWQYERYNPRRKHVRRRSSVQKRLDALETEGMHEENRENEKNHRIEEWRMEQSRALLEEIERETRRQRRMSRAGVARSSADTVEEDQASMNSPTMEEVTRVDLGPQPEQETENVSFWQRITRKVIHDLMGIDEDLLSVIFGETLSDDTAIPPHQTQQAILGREDAHLPTSSWQHRLLQRVACELGILVHHISEHPGAFSTYLRTQETPTFVGLSPAANDGVKFHSAISPVEPNQPSFSTPLSAPFAPTLRQASAAADVSMWGIETEADFEATRAPRRSHLPNIAEEPTNPDVAAAAQEREYWEQELDIKMVFNYLRKRFSSRPTSPEPDDSKEIRRDSGFAGSTDMSVSPESRKRAALIRRHHPLTSRAAPAERATSSASRRSDLLHRHHLHHHTHGYNHTGVAGMKRPGSSSCASQSTKSRKSLGRQSAGSSRNYWDIGGSVGSAGFGSDAGIA